MGTSLNSGRKIFDFALNLALRRMCGTVGKESLNFLYLLYHTYGAALESLRIGHKWLLRRSLVYQL